jgi:hypothetical protein
VTASRLIRIGIVAGVFAALFTGSQAATMAREGETVPGVRWAVGTLSVLFLVRAIVTEWTRGPEDDFQKDILWGMAAGGMAGIAATLWALS